MGEERVLVIGAGMAGLTVADCLSNGGFEVLMLEARPRAGGRIHTIHPEFSSAPVELGAEFIHGDRNEVWDLAAEVPGFHTTETPDRHWEVRNGKLRENEHFWEDLEEVMGKFEEAKRDETFASFMRRLRGVSEHARTLARDYVEGFHAARPEKIGIAALAEAEAAAEKAHGQRQFHVAGGYDSLVRWKVQRLQEREVGIRFEAIARAVRWRRGKVGVLVNGEVIAGRAAVVTVPLGVLQAVNGEGAIVFEPALPKKRRAIEALRMGNIVKLTLALEEPIWPREVSGFIHAHGAAFPTWWIDERGLVLTGWAGAARADAFSRKSEDAILQTAIAELAEVFGVGKGRIERAIRQSFRHDWRNDPLSRGAYSFVPAGESDATAELAEPVEDTLFFAGEALAPAGEQGTVHGAITSGMKAAELVKDRS
jgi:monoamine oxidase